MTITAVTANGKRPSVPVVISTSGPTANPAAPADPYTPTILPRQSSSASSLMTASLADHSSAAAAPSRNLSGNQAYTCGKRPNAISVPAASKVACCMVRAAPARRISRGINGASNTPALACATMLRPMTVLLIPCESRTSDRSGNVNPYTRLTMTIDAMTAARPRLRSNETALPILDTSCLMVSRQTPS